jgi:pyrroline-5-carboxylate reductase
MPNTPVRVGRGVVGLVAGTRCSAEQLQQVVRLLDPVSTVIVMDESLIDSLTATSGSGPAYVFYLAESMMKAAMDLGLDRSTASTLVAETIAGSALLLASEPDDPAALRAAVTSPGGTTAAAIGVFDSEGLARTIEDGMRAAHGRAGEMSAERAARADQE